MSAARIGTRGWGRHGALCCALTILALGWAGVALASGPAIKIDTDRIPDRQFKEKGVLSLYVDVIDARDHAVDRLDKDTIKLLINGELQGGDRTVQTLQEANEGTAIMLVLPAFQAFTSGEGGRQATEKMLAGARTFLRRLGPGDHIAVATYDETTAAVRQPFSKDPDAAVRFLQDFARDVERPPPTGELPLPPLLGRHLRYLLESGFNAENLPERRILLLVTSGHDELLGRDANREVNERIDALVSVARDANYGPPRRVFLVGVQGFTERDKLARFRSLAERTGGAYEEAEHSSDLGYIALEDGVVNLGDRILRQLIIYWAPDSWRGGRGKLTVEVDVKGTLVRDEWERKWRERPYPWLRALLIGLGSLVGAVLLFMMIRGIGRAMARRRAMPVDTGDPEAMPGKTRAALAITAGPHSGEELYLTEATTTVGRGEACDYQLSDAGMGRRHAAFHISGMRFEIRDLNSTNGTYINGQRIREAVFLKDGDRIHMGETDMEFRLVR